MDNNNRTVWPTVQFLDSRTSVRLYNFTTTCLASTTTSYSYSRYSAEAEAEPWDKMCIDLIGPYKIRRRGQEDLIFRCVTMIDPATGWFKIHEYDDKRSITVANIAEQEWFCRYPWPTQVTFALYLE